MDYKEAVWEIVRRIPRGEVATYGQIAEIINYKFQITKGLPQLT